MKIGFTGTRDGMTPEQSMWFDTEANMGSFGGENHHGDCVGADAEFHYYAWRYGGHIVVHPPTDPRLRAFVHERPTDGDAVLWEPSYILREPRPYLDRNRDIVDETDRLIACPREWPISREFWADMKGGTWHTIRYAIKQGKPVTVVFANGSTVDG